MEYWDICDREGNPTGRKVTKGETFGEGEYHIAVEVWIVNSRKEFLIQKRSHSCHLYPDIWSLTAGRVQAGEDSCEGIIREIKEEIGLDVQREELKCMKRLNREDGSHMIWDVFLLKRDAGDDELILDEREVAEVRWVSGREMEEMILDREIFVYPEMMDFLHQIEADEV